MARPTGELADQQLRQLSRAEIEAPVDQHHDHRQMLHLGVEMKKACICTSSSTTGFSGVPASAERGQNAPSRRWFAALSSGAHSRKASAQQ